MEFQKTAGWLDWYAGPSRPRFKLPPGAVDGALDELAAHPRFGRVVRS